MDSNIDEATSKKGTALEGIRVIDWSNRMQGPVAAQILGYLGADVIKIEEPVKGDPARGTIRYKGISQVLADGNTASFVSQNRNKRGIAVNLRKPGGREIIHRLVEKSDVFVNNQRKDVPEKLGLDYPTLSRLNPMLVYGQGGGLGPEGPESGLPIMDIIGVARSGMMSLGKEADGGPRNNIPGMADDAAAVMLAFGIVTALFARQSLGVGQRVDTSVLGAAIGLIRRQVANYYMLGKQIEIQTSDKVVNPLYNRYQCKDGKWIILSLHQGERFWGDFCRALGKPELIKDTRFSDSIKREENAGELLSIIKSAFASRTYEEWDVILKKEGDFIYGAVRSIEDLATDPQVIENRYLVDFDDPTYGLIKVPGLPFGLSRTPWAVTRRAPELGQHTEEVLTEILGYSWDQISALKDEGVIG